MNPQISVITLGVDDLDRALRFYREGLGLPTKGIVGAEFKGDEQSPAGAVVMFKLAGDLLLALYPRTELAKDAQTRIGPGSPTEFSIGQIVGSKEEVDTLLDAAAAAGAIITDKPHHRAWGIYSGYFQDPDGHLWEIIWNPKSVQ
ncbi:MAG TPA: VOC family protein [Tepidisphaeraceae bacterium]|nr:VOC family protein [Tepidisphaeraceae bacterium]